jgi:hypothetical protein
MDIIALVKLIWGFASSRLGILLISIALLGGFGLYHKISSWASEHKIDSLTKERDIALGEIIKKKAEINSLEKTVKFQREQLSLQQRVQKESGDVKEAVRGNDRDFLGRNFDRLYNYKNPTTGTDKTGGNKGRFIPTPKTETPK